MYAYHETHVSAEDGSTAMAVSYTPLVLINEDGITWYVDNDTEWLPIDPDVISVVLTFKPNKGFTKIEALAEVLFNIGVGPKHFDDEPEPWPGEEGQAFNSLDYTLPDVPDIPLYYRR